LIIAGGLLGPWPVARAQPPPTGALTIAWGGDVHLGRGVAAGLAMPGHPDPFAAIRQELDGADLAVANLEGPLTTVPRVGAGHDLTGDPGRVALLAQAGFDLLSLANNHATDNGRAGLAETIGHLRAAGIAVVGAGADRDQAAAPVRLRRRELRLAFFAFNLTPPSLTATDRAAGVAAFEPDLAVPAIRAARRESDLVLVQLHWGTEYAAAPDEPQRLIAHELVAAGADAVVGHHAHVVQPIEWVERAGRRPALVAYSLGNLLFDSDVAEARRGLLLTTWLDRRGVVGIRVLGVHTDGRGIRRQSAADQAALARRLPPAPAEARPPTGRHAGVTSAQVDSSTEGR
jgi:poly-gamma-glutamate synthesis protein (capsule biosynthesis protein)